MARAIHLNLDNAWPAARAPGGDAGCHIMGTALRFSAPPRLIEEFYREHQARITPFILYGSGDFHHLSALWVRRIADPFVLVSFDNHPDWDVRPPRWGCGGWVNRALELSNVTKVSVWGCGNFECWWPRQIFGNRRAERAGRLEVHPWADERPGFQSESARRDLALELAAKFRTVRRANWKDRTCMSRSISIACGRGRRSRTGRTDGSAWRMSLGAGAAARGGCGDRGGRYLRRVFAAELRASKTTFRRGNGPSEIAGSRHEIGAKKLISERSEPCGRS